MQKALVIGSGIAGIASAIRMAHKGYEVHVFESNDYPGGKLTSFQKDGFRFDAGPSLFTLPELVTELFELFGEESSDHFTYRRMDTICNYFWEDGTRFSMPADYASQIKFIASKFNEPQDKIRRYFKKSKTKYELTAPIFIEKSLHRLSTYLSFDMLKAFTGIHKFDIFSSLNGVNKNTFSNPKLIQLLNRFATYNGSSPYKTPGIMSMIPHLEMNIGTFFPEGGMQSITDALVSLAERHGVVFHYDSFVEKIVHDGNSANGIFVNNDLIQGDVVIANMDIFSAYSLLLKDIKQPHKILKQERSSSALIFYWGINRTFAELDLHNILFSESYEEEFEYIFDKKTIHKDPTIYINISAKENKGDAPNGSENWFVMINTPSDTGQDWQALIAEARKNILEKINRVLKVDLEPIIQCEEMLNPKTIASKTMSHQGALYGSASNNRYAAFLRHSNFSNDLKNLYFCGGSVHPGGGLPLCLNSAKIVSNIIG